MKTQESRKGEAWTPKIDEECADGCARNCWHDQNPKTKESREAKQVGHTTGPWKAIKHWDDDAWSIATEEYFQAESGEGPIGRLPICDLSNIEGAEANARLIAAAPELLEAAKAIALKAEYCDDGNQVVSLMIDGNELKALRAAIAKAEGR